MEGTNEELKKDLTGKEGIPWDAESCGLLYRGDDCCYSSCSYTSNHYHCQVCGIISTEAAQAIAHVRSSPGCRKDPSANYSSTTVGMAGDPTNSLFNAIYNGFSAQNSFSSASFSGYSQLDSFQWHPSMSDKVAICSAQLSPCCSSNGGTFVPVESQLCSPISDLYSKVTPIRDLVSLPAKSSGSAMDSQAWFAAYNTPQMQKSTYKYPDQNPPPQMNYILLDPTDQKNQDTGESNTNISSNYCAKSDLNGKSLELKESYCAYASQSMSQPLQGIISEDALFSLQLQEETLKQADVPQMLLENNVQSKCAEQVNTVASSRVETNFTQEHFNQYMPSCSAFTHSINQENHGRSAEVNNQLSSAASDSDESDIIVEDTGDDLGSQMTESEIFIEDIKCSLLQGVVSDEENSINTAAFSNKRIADLEHPMPLKEPKESRTVEETKLQSESHLKSCMPPYHTILKCVICEKSASDDNSGSVFVQMNNQMPLTTSSNTPVLTKLNEVVAIEVTDFLDVNGKLLCQSCFNLVDTVDTLESKLESLKQDIATLIKNGSKPLIVRHNHCSKLPMNLMESDQDTIMNIHSRVKDPSVAACVQDLFQDPIVANSSIARPVSIQDEPNQQNSINDSGQKEYMLLSGRALCLANSIEKVSLSLGQHHTAQLLHGAENTTHPIVNEESPDLSKMPSLSYQVSSAALSTMKESESINSHIEAFTLNDVSSALEGAKEMNTFQRVDGAVEAYESASYGGKVLRSTSKEEVLRQCEKNEGKEGKGNQSIDILEKEEVCLPLNLPTQDQSPHSLDCQGKNCHEILRSDKKIQENILRQQNSDQLLSFSCNVCGDLFSSNQHLNNHLSSYSQSDTSLCEHCGQLYHNQAQLDDHIFLVHHIYQKRCEVCAMKFSHPCMYQTHMRLHPGEKPTSYSQKCVSGFKTGAQGNSPSDSFPFVCYKCSKTFQLRSHLEHHIKTTHILKKALSKCDQCDRTFIKPSDLEAHKRSHSNDKKFECKVCGRRYKSLGNLNHHSKSHDTKKPFTCEVCSQGFTRKDFFEAHINSHKDSKPYKCEKCQKGFLSKSYLQVHLKWHMDKIKKVTCPICKKTFSQRLNVHMRSHTGERPHPCGKCPKKFVTGSALRKHMKRIHQSNFSEDSVYSASDGSDSELPELGDSTSLPCSG